MAAIGQAVGDHFAFGENWRAFAAKVSDDRIASATEAMRNLLGDIRNKAMLDIGCGSGLHALAALRLGAAHVTAIDVDPVSVATTKALLAAHAPDGSWETRVADVFALDGFGKFDVVCSWGVLHHTGDVNRAIRAASEHVAPGGTFCIAIYRKTALCGFWKREKKLYSRSGPMVQGAIRSIYLAWLFAVRSLACALHGTLFRPASEIREMKARGMDFFNDVHDWLGGYPYESMSPEEVRDLSGSIGMTEVRANVQQSRSLGLTGSGCDEYVFRRIT